jgi:hypothetical protein
MKDIKPPIDAKARNGGYQAPIEDATGEKISRTEGIKPMKPIMQITVIATGREFVVDIIKAFLQFAFEQCNSICNGNLRSLTIINSYVIAS